MNDLNSELAWEQNMLNFGLARFRAQETAAKERKDYTGTNGGKRLLKGYLSQVSEFIADYTAGNSPGGRRRSKFAPLLGTVEPDKLALFALTEIVKTIYSDTPVVRLAYNLGIMIEDELKFTEFQLAKPELFNQLQRSLDDRNSESYRHRHRVLTNGINKAAEDFTWKQWNTETVAGVGSLLLSLALDATDLVYKETVQRGPRKKEIVLRPTPEVLTWIEKSDEALAVMLPDRMPTLIPPADWESERAGGYHLPRLRMSTPLVKTRRGRAGEMHKNLLSTARMDAVRAAVNSMQRTPWAVNKPVLEALQRVWEANLGVGMPPSQPYEIPKCPIPEGKTPETDEEKELLEGWKAEARELHSMEKHRRSLVLGVARTMRISEMLKEQERFYYVYQLDFRGRVYAATSGVTPQGSDPAKAVLQFADGKRVGDRGAYWLKVHGANKFGYDKVSYDARVAWIEARGAEWLAVADDPVGNRAIWAEADKPYQFLAFCFEYRGLVDDGPDHVSRLPVALDGSCNGLQHFSAMLRDPIGGAAVNLVPSERPSDIYQDVADVCIEDLRSCAVSGDDLGRRTAAGNWLAFFAEVSGGAMSRKWAKSPVMTLPYGSTQQACTGSLFSMYTETGVKFFPEGTAFKHCVLLSEILWKAIGKVVVAARVAMDWVQECAGILAKEDEPLVYHSLLGMPVYQGTQKAEVKRVCHRIGGSRMRLHLRVEKEGMDTRKQRQGSSPNLVHHVDATHMMMCINAGAEEGIDSFAMIHDDFGCHACHTEDFQRIIREQFLRLHTEHDCLAAFKQEQEAYTGVQLPDLPARGTLDLRDVLDSPYFFG